MFIGFLSYTNDALIENHDQDISLLDESVLDVLDIRGLDKNERSFISAEDRAVVFGATCRRAEAKEKVLQQKSVEANLG